MLRAPFRLAGALAPLALAACSPEPIEVTRPVVVREVASPAEDATSRCADVAGGLRVCWSDAGEPVSLSSSPFPGPGPGSSRSGSGRGFVCEGQGKERRCVDRGHLAPPFQCEGKRCTQRHPRLPDDGEWECADIAGAVVCRGGEPAAGTAPGGRGRGFVCGARRVQRDVTGERLCVDLSPDLPEGSGPGVRCHFEASSGLTRVCELGTTGPSLGAVCARERPCVDGAVCVPEAGKADGTGGCSPLRPDPSCWLPGDCDQGTCRFGTCTRETAP